MIASGVERSRELFHALSAGADFSRFGPSIPELCRELMETVVDAEFPGALIPTIDQQGGIRILVVASSMSLWRKLSPVLSAFAGPTLTSFDGLVRDLPQGDASAGVVASSDPAATSIMDLPADPQAMIAALRSLTRLRSTLARSPSLQRKAPEPTSWLLAKFQDYLNVGRREPAEEILRRLKTELRLDALNLKFLEVQLLAAVGEWRSIVELQGFASLCLARKSPAVTAILLEALYNEHIALPFERSDEEETRARFEADVRHLARPMLTIPAPASLTNGGWRLYALEGLADSSRTDIGSALIGRFDAIGWLAEKASRPVDSAPKVATQTTTLIDDARGALVRVNEADSVDSLAEAISALAKLSPEEVRRLREAEPFRAAMEVAESAERNGLPNSWVEWLAMAEKPEFLAALEVAQKGKDEWSIDASTGDPTVVSALVLGLNRAFSTEISAERTAQALPFLVAWLQRDPEFPRPAMTVVYSNLLTLFALSSARGRVTYESSQILVNASLSAGLDSTAYRSLIADVNELSGDGFGVNMVYWMLEIIEAFYQASTPDPAARQSFLHAALARIAPIYSRLSSFQREATSRLATELGWTLDSLGVRGELPAADDLASLLHGKRIAIYTLTESVGRLAKQAIEGVEPSATVECNSDHVGTGRLRALAEGADIFVVSWLSAKHAATDFIRDRRANRPILYAQGRGFSSILRAIEDHFGVHN